MPLQTLWILACRGILMMLSIKCFARVHKKYLFPALCVSRKSPWVGRKWKHAVMQMWRFTFCVAAITHATNNVALASKIKRFGVNCVEVRIIMNAPFWPQHRHYIAAHINVASVNHQAIAATNHARAFWGEYINAFMHPRFSPRRKPKIFRVPVFSCSVFYWHSPARWQQQPKREEASE